jgi:hypothetical protein
MTISRGQMKRQLQRGGGIMDVAEGFGGGRFVGSAMGNNRTGFNFVSDALGGVKDALKGAAKGIGDILSSDAGKLALLGLGGYGLATGSFGLPQLSMPKFATDFLAKEGVKGTLGALGVGAIFGGAFAGKSEEEVEAITRDKNALKSYLTQYYTNLNPELRNQPEKVEKFVESQIVEYNQGRGGYAAGGDTASDNAMQAAGIEGLPIRQNPKGVKELDLRNTGGFIPPVGIKEKEDDIPAMLSNNEFVFTADAVRGMGEGDVNKGAERMYRMMKTLEAGGRV